MSMKPLFIIILALGLVGCATPPNPDLYANVQNSKATSDAALQQAFYQSQFLTATAEAPIVHITETAAGMVFQQQMWTATVQSIQGTQVAAMTQTAIVWTPTPNATQTAVFAMAAAEATAISNNTQRDLLQLERERQNNEFNRLLPGIAVAALMGALIVAAIVAIRMTRYRPMTVDTRGNVIPVMDILDGTVTDVDRNPNYRGLLSDNLFRQWMMQRFKLAPQLPAITAQRQDATTERDQMIDLATRGLPGPTTDARERGKLAGQGMMKQLSDSNLETRFKILDGQTGGLEVIDGVIVQELDSAWKEAKA
jgi:PBP1b-binding outer membrane lipoprotein LpoB